MRTKQRVAIVVCHELAHQWFGNLVTMEWWTHLWLNEGFASFMEYLCTDALFPEWNIWEQFVSADMFGAMNLDALDSSHPIEVAVGHPSEVDEIFDQISYSKGCAVIRMLHNWIGDAAFRSGMEAYLNKFAYNNALTEDLWEELGKASGKPVNDVMSGWTSRMGFPMVSVSVVNWSDNELKDRIQNKTENNRNNSEKQKFDLVSLMDSQKFETSNHLHFFPFWIISLFFPIFFLNSWKGKIESEKILKNCWPGRGWAVEDSVDHQLISRCTGAVCLWDGGKRDYNFGNCSKWLDQAKCRFYELASGKSPLLRPLFSANNCTFVSLKTLERSNTTKNYWPLWLQTSQLWALLIAWHFHMNWTHSPQLVLQVPLTIWSSSRVTPTKQENAKNSLL